MPQPTIESSSDNIGQDAYYQLFGGFIIIKLFYFNKMVAL